MYKTFFYTRAYKNYSLKAGTYLIECFGAQGGDGIANGVTSSKGGYGAYTAGIMELKEEKTLYFYVGGRGENGKLGHELSHGGWNGGGNSGSDTGALGGNDGSGGGGGASDIREKKGDMNSRIMVAAGGSGAVWTFNGAPGGELIGLKQNPDETNTYTKEKKVNQTRGYRKGYGQSGQDSKFTPSSGAGGGFWGGISYSGGNLASIYGYSYVASSGSSYVSGRKDCNVYKNFMFKNTRMESGVQAGDGMIRVTEIVINIVRTCKHKRFASKTSTIFILTLINVT